MHCNQRGQLAPPLPKGWKSLERFEKQEVEDHGSQKDRYPRSGSSLTSVLHAHLWVVTPRWATLEESSSCMVAGPWRRRAKLGKESTHFSLALQTALWQLGLKSLLGARRLELCIPPPFHGPDRNKRIHVNPRGVWRNRRQDSPICLVTATESAKLVSQEIFLEELFNWNAWRSTRIAITRSVLIF